MTCDVSPVAMFHTGSDYDDYDYDYNFANMIMQKCMFTTLQAVIMMIMITITIMQIHIDHFAGGA